MAGFKDFLFCRKLCQSFPAVEDEIWHIKKKILIRVCVCVCVCVCKIITQICLVSVSSDNVTAVQVGRFGEEMRVQGRTGSSFFVMRKN